MSQSTITFLILGLTVAVFIWDRLPVGVVAFGVALSLWATGVLELEQSLGGFGDPTVIFIASLFVVSEGLDSTGVTAWAGQELIARAGDSRTRLLLLMMLLVAVLTALISVNGAVAALLPVVAVMAVRLRMSPSQILMPLAFGAHAGSLLALTGSPVNVIVSEYADDAGSRQVRVLRVRAGRHPTVRRDGRDRRPLRRAAAADPKAARDHAGLRQPRPDTRRPVRARRRPGRAH